MDQNDTSGGVDVLDDFAPAAAFPRAIGPVAEHGKGKQCGGSGGDGGGADEEQPRSASDATSTRSRYFMWMGSR
jgi:hypothetical protein